MTIPVTERVMTGGHPYLTWGICLPGISDKGATAIRAALDHAARIGARIIRADLDWRWVEATQGTYSWAGWDTLMTEAEARGISVLPVCHTSPQWSTGSASSAVIAPTTATQRGHYASFCAAFTTRYKGRIRWFEVWNEPNLDQFWAPTPDAAAYVALLTAARNAIRGVDPSVTVISGGLGGSGGAPDIAPQPYLTAAYAAGLAAACDAVAIHPYTLADGQVSGGLYEAELLRKIMDNHGDAAKPLWATETGAPTGGTSGQYVTTDAGQAGIVDLTARHWHTIIRHGGPVIWYCLYDDASKQPDREGWFGVITSGGADKPAVAALARQSATVTSPGTVPVTRYVKTSSGNVKVKRSARN